MIYEEMYQEYRTYILAYAWHSLHDPELAEDITQETFLRAWRGFAQLRPGSSASAWLHRIARNVMVDYLRKKRVPSSPLQEYEDLVGEDIQDSVGCREQIYSILAHVPLLYREALLLSYAHGYPEQVIAERLGVTRDTIRMRLMRGRNYFKDCYRTMEESVA